MNESVSDVLLGVTLIYCRVGPCILFLPGFGQQQIPRTIRGLLSVAVAASIWPAVSGWAALTLKLDQADLVAAVGREICVGLLLGLAGKSAMAAIESFGAVISASVGLSANIGIALDTEPHGPALATLCSLLATLAVIASDAHLAMIKGIVESYAIIDLKNLEQRNDLMTYFVDSLVTGYQAGLAIASPFIFFSFMVNMFLALIAKFIPRLQIFYISGPFLIGGGLWLLQSLAGEILDAFVDLLDAIIPLGR